MLEVTCLLVYKHMSSVTQGYNNRNVHNVTVDKNTLHLPFKIKATVENKNQIYANAHRQSKTKI